MVLNIKRESIVRLWDNSLDVASFAGVGYLCGRLVNSVTKWTAKPSFFEKAKLVDVNSAAICCALFMAIDRVSYSILSSYIDKKELNKPAYIAMRIGVNLSAAVGLFNVLATPLQRATVELKGASVIILTAIAVYSQILLYLRVFNDRDDDKIALIIN